MNYTSSLFSLCVLFLSVPGMEPHKTRSSNASTILATLRDTPAFHPLPSTPSSRLTLTSFQNHYQNLPKITSGVHFSISNEKSHIQRSSSSWTPRDGAHCYYKNLNTLQKLQFDVAVNTRTKFICHELHQATNLLKTASFQMGNGKPLSGEGVVAWLALNNTTLSALNKEFHEAVTAIQNLTSDSFGEKDRSRNDTQLFFPLMDIPKNSYQAERTQKALDAIHTFERAVDNYLANIDAIVQEEIAFHHDQLSNELITDEKFWSNVCEGLSAKKRYGYETNTHSEVTLNPLYKTLTNVVTHCEAGNFERACAILDAMPTNMDQLAGRSAYQYLFDQRYNNQGFCHEFTNLPYLENQSIQPPCYTMKNGCTLPLPNPLNSRLQRIVDLQKHFNNPSNTLTNEILYGIATNDIINADIQKYVETFHLFRDSENPLVQAAYNDFYDHGIVKGSASYLLPDQLHSIPECIGNKEFLSERQLLAGLASQKIVGIEQKKLFDTVLSNLKHGLSDSPLAPAARSLAHAHASILRNPEQEHAHLIQNLGDYTKQAPTEHAQRLQKAAADLITRHITTIDNNTYNNTSRVTVESPDIIMRVDHAYKAMLEGDIGAEDYLQRGIIPEINRDILKLAHDETAILNTESKAPAQLTETKEAINDILTTGERFKLLEYSVGSEVRKLLEQLGKDPSNYRALYGNQVQHVIHAHNLENVTDLSQEKVAPHTFNEEFRNTIVEVIDHSVQLNATGDIPQASLLSCYGAQMVGFFKEVKRVGIEVGIGFKDGISQGFRQTIHTFSHPKETMQNIGKLTILTIKLFGDATCLEDSFFLPEREIQNIRENIIPVLDAAKEKLQNASIRDVVREATAFGIDSLLTHRTCMILGKACSITTNAIVEKLIKTDGVMSDLEVITAEGLKVTTKPPFETGLLNEAEEIIQNGTKTIGKQFTQEAVEEGVKYATTKNKIKHIFDKAEHNLEPLVKRFGNYENTVREILKAVDGKLPMTGLFDDIPVNVDGFTVYVRGVVIDEIPKLGTFFIK